MKNYIYRITFLTKMNGHKHWVYDVEADNQKEAKQIAYERWTDAHDSHPFHMDARRLKDNEELLFNWFKPASLII